MATFNRSESAPAIAGKISIPANTDVQQLKPSLKVSLSEGNVIIVNNPPDLVTNLDVGFVIELIKVAKDVIDSIWGGDDDGGDDDSGGKGGDKDEEVIIKTGGGTTIIIRRQ